MASRSCSSWQVHLGLLVLAPCLVHCFQVSRTVAGQPCSVLFDSRAKMMLRRRRYARGLVTGQAPHVPTQADAKQAGRGRISGFGKALDGLTRRTEGDGACECATATTASDIALSTHRCVVCGIGRTSLLVAWWEPMYIRDPRYDVWQVYVIRAISRWLESIRPAYLRSHLCST